MEEADLWAVVERYHRLCLDFKLPLQLRLRLVPHFNFIPCSATHRLTKNSTAIMCVAHCHSIITPSAGSILSGYHDQLIYPPRLLAALFFAILSEQSEPLLSRKTILSNHVHVDNLLIHQP